MPSPITSIKGGEKGCPSAVWDGGAPAKEYCDGNDNKFPWWSTCCTWKWNPDLGIDSCLPKSCTFTNCKGLKVGCGGDDPEPLDETDPSQTGAVRCCNDDSCISPDSCLETTYDQAQATCTANGRRLCTLTELVEGKCCGTGCGFDSALNWYNEIIGNGIFLSS